ncbi:DUF937 domain-containing protein [Mycobacterium sp. NPDC003323]
MAGLDDLYAQIPVADIAARLGAGQSEVDNAIRTLVPALVGGVQANVQADDIDSTDLEAAVGSQAGSRLFDGGVTVDDVDTAHGDKIVADIFGGNDSNSVASALTGGGVANGDLIRKLLPILAPIVLAYIGKQFGGGADRTQAGGGGLGDVLGGILGGGSSGGGDNPLGSILGSVLGGGSGAQGNPIGDILGGLLGGRK